MASISSPITSGSQLASSIPSDIFAELSDVSSVDTSPADADVPADEPAEDLPADTDAVDDSPLTEGEPAEAPITEPEAPAPARAEPAQPESEKVAGEEDLPEGVYKAKDAKGNTVYRLRENRYKTFHDNHKLVREATDVIGETFTLDGLKQRNDAWIAQENLYGALESGDPTQQRSAVDAILADLAEARTNGEVGLDAAVPLAETVYDALRDQAPDGYAALRKRAATDLISEMFEKAAGSQNKSLFSAAQHFVAALLDVGPRPENVTPEQYVSMLRETAQEAGLPFYVPDEMGKVVKSVDPTEELRQENLRLREQLQGKTQGSTEDAYASWWTDHRTSVNGVISNEIQQSLTSIANDWKAFPADFERLVKGPLSRDIQTAVMNDAALNRQVVQLQESARRAVSPDIRKQYGQRIEQLMMDRAKRALEENLPPIAKFAAETLRSRSSARNTRRAGAQSQSAPRGTGTPVNRSVVPPELVMKNGFFDAKVAAKQALLAVNGL